VKAGKRERERERERESERVRRGVDEKRELIRHIDQSILIRYKIEAQFTVEYTCID